MIVLLVVAFASVVAGFFLAAMESSLVRISKSQARELLEEGRRGAVQLVRLVDNRGPVAMVLAFLRVVAEATAAVLVTLAADRIFDDFWVTLLVAIGVMALASFILVGVSPRTFGQQHATAMALFGAPLVSFFLTVLGPVARGLVAVGNAVTPGPGFRDGPFASEEELRDFVDMATDSQLIEADERRMIHSVFELGDTVAREVMVPRTDMVIIDKTKSLRSAMSLFLRSGFSRVPVVDDGPDDIEGLVFLKDVARRLTLNPDSASLPVTEVAREVAFIPDSKPIDDLLREMQTSRQHFAVVIDEYGGTAGLITLEDIIEEVVGEIDDEYDRVAPGVEEMPDGVLRIPARMPVDDLAELMDVTLEDDDVDTVGGLLAKLIGRVPIPGATAQIAGLQLTADEMAGRRHQIATILVSRVRSEDEPSVDHEEVAAP